MDDAYLGGGTVGRGSENKVPFVASVSLDEMGHPVYLKLTMVAGFTRDAIKEWANVHLAPGTVVTTDGLGCFAAVIDAGCVHMPTVVGDRKPRDLPEFAWVNTVLGNLKTALAGAHHAFNYRKYAGHYLAAFAYRFNRRFDLHTLVVRLIVAVAHARALQPQTCDCHSLLGLELFVIPGLRLQGAGVREMARTIGRAASTVSRELRRNA